jgi:tetratricopeptide (TPR) repeat protein
MLSNASEFNERSTSAATPAESKDAKGRSKTVGSLASTGGTEIAGTGIEVEGISPEKIAALYHSMREHQHHVEGDVVFTRRPQASDDKESSVPSDSEAPGGLILRARIQGVGSWSSQPHECNADGMTQAVSELVIQIMTDFSPYTLALYYQSQRQSDKAIDLLRRLTAEDPNDANRVSDLALALQNNNDWSAAIEEYRAALDLQPSYPERIHNNLGLALYYNGQVEEAEQEFTHSIRLNTSYEDPHDNLGNLYREDGNLNKASLQFSRALHINSHDAVGHDGLGRVFEAQFRAKDAIREYRQAVHFEPSNFNFHLDFGNALDDGGDFAAAASEYRHVIRLEPTNPWGYIDLGNALMDAGTFEECATQTARGMQYAAQLPAGEERQRTLASAYNNLGYAFWLEAAAPRQEIERQGSTKGEMLERAAIEQYRAALTLEPDLEKAQVNLALALRSIPALYEASDAIFRRAGHIGSRSDAADARSAFGECIKQRGPRSGSL